MLISKSSFQFLLSLTVCLSICSSGVQARAGIQDSLCPDEEALAPCTCWESPEGLELDCSGVSSNDQLESIFQTTYFPTKSFGTLFIINNPNITRLGNILNGVTLAKVEIQSTNLSFVSEYFLSDSFVTLNSLWISGSNLRTEAFPFLTLNYYTNLEYLIIGNSELTYIPLLHSDSLKYAVFPLNKIETIEPGIFNRMEITCISNIDYLNSKDYL